MSVRFEINYRCAAGEWLAIEGDFKARLQSVDGVVWSASVELEMGQWGYYYIVCNEMGVVCREMVVAINPALLHRVDVVGGRVYCRRDEWIDTQISRPMSSTFFTKSVFKRHTPQCATIDGHILEFNYVEIDSAYTLVVVGGASSLGNWCVDRGLEMADGDYPLWRVALPRLERSVEYKIVMVERSTRRVVEWEMGANRVVQSVVCEEGITFDSVATPRFGIDAWRGIGVSIPVFSLRTDRSMGVGDFGDIRSMVDWAADRCMNVIQILPINDTTMSSSWEDSYPYNANSTMALHPQYIALEDVGTLADSSLAEKYIEQGRALNKLQKIDYTAVNGLKQSYLRDMYAQDGVSTRRRKAYREFMAANREWLEPYALFSTLRDRYSTPDFRTWGDDSQYDEKMLHRSDVKGEMEFYFFVQYHLHCQLTKAVEYAHSRGVAIKGDIPIGISRTSVDAWISPELFRMDMQAGAPPDAFAVLGQNWGFPTYNWERMAQDNYAWWRGRMTKMAEYFDAYRIDHILGFFRIWQIPMSAVHGILGHFSPAMPLSLEQICDWGFEFDECFTHPRITDDILVKYLSTSNIDVAKQTYLQLCDDGQYIFVEAFDTQRKVHDGVVCETLRDGLLMLFDEVLFVEDAVHKGMYHPRITAYETMAYKALSQENRAAFDRLYNDFYYHRHDDFWRVSAMQKLPSLIQSTEMLVCGEDLGMIPACVAEVMEREQILSLEIERMPKSSNCEFGDPAHYPYLSVCTTSTHDMSTIRGWWREDLGQTQRYYNHALGMDGSAEMECSGRCASQIIDRHINSPAMLTILPWQDWMAVDEELRCEDVDGERINVPAISRHYWRYRMHITL